MAQSLVSMKAHVIFSTKGRQPSIKDAFRDRLYAYMGAIIRDRSSTLLAAGGMPDHMHLLVGLHPTIALADLVRDVKANSSRLVHEEFPAHEFAWQNGYAGFSVSESAAATVHAYIANQAKHHRVMTFKGELIAFLEKHHVAYDPEYIWT